MTFRFSGFDRIPRKSALIRLARKTCASIPKLAVRGEINFVLVSDKEIRRIHKRFMNDPSATDVITFHYERPLIKTKGEPGPFADVYISMDTAQRRARRKRYPAYQEIALLMVHGLLHAAGYDDLRPQKKKIMFAKQKSLLDAIDPSLAPPDFR